MSSRAFVLYNIFYSAGVAGNVLFNVEGLSSHSAFEGDGSCRISKGDPIKRFMMLQLRVYDQKFSFSFHKSFTQTGRIQ